jgi:hypothetical protein
MSRACFDMPGGRLLMPRPNLEQHEIELDRHARAWPFEERRRLVYHRAGHFGPDPLACLSRASTSYNLARNKDVDGRDKPGHDEVIDLPQLRSLICGPRGGLRAPQR